MNKIGDRDRLQKRKNWEYWKMGREARRDMDKRKHKLQKQHKQRGCLS